MTTLEKIVSLAKRRGFVFPGSEIYGGLANTWDYGPLGVELKNNIKNAWWKRFVHQRRDIVGLDAAIIMNPRVWEASGHVAHFADPLKECKFCHLRLRPDYLEAIEKARNKTVARQITNIAMGEDTTLLIESQICEKSPDKKHNWTEAKNFNLMFKTFIGPAEETANVAYLRPETAQAIFINFKNIIDTTRIKIPFGVAQIGKAFRNEITPGNFIFRVREFEQMEIEFFIPEPKSDKEWQKVFDMWVKEIWEWIEQDLGLKRSNVIEYDVPPNERAHYSKKTIDFKYKFPFGTEELYGLAYRGDYDLLNHYTNLSNSQKDAGDILKYQDPETGKKYFPHVIEPSLGVDRSVLAVLIDAYHEDSDRVVLKLNPKLAPYKAAVFPLLANKPDLIKKAQEVYRQLSAADSLAPVSWDDRGNIGKRYYAQDEIGTPYCVTCDFETLDDNTVTVRDRDTAKQERVKVEKLIDFLSKNLV